MSIFRRFRNAHRNQTAAERAEILRLRRTAPNDKPAGIRHNHDFARSQIGWW